MSDNNKILAGESLNRALLNALPFPAMLINRDRTLLACNQAAAEMGVVPGTHCWDTFGKLASIPAEDKEFFITEGRPPEGGTRCTFCQGDQALDTQEHQNTQVDTGEAVFDTYWVPLTPDIYLHYARLV